MLRKLNIKAIASAVGITALAMVFPVSCSIREDLPPCPKGLNLRFVYDYNMEFANAFPSKVDCYTTYIYDKDGKFMESFSETGEKLKDENYRLQVDLPMGDYQLVTYGGTTCGQRSFDLETVPEQGTDIKELEVELHHREGVSDQALHPLYHSVQQVSVEGELYKDETVHLMCNTNNLRIVLQHLNTSPVEADHFDFEIVDDNRRLDGQNNKMPDGDIVYRPWAKGTVRQDLNGGKDLQAAYAEFSMSRLFEKANTTLRIRRIEDNETVLELPLIPYLLMLKSDLYSQMGNQEFLDRQNDWSMVFFLDEDNLWVKTQIIINGWVVRLNDQDF